jgi:hypothetical protein
MRELGRDFRGARVDGSYPNTEIVVNYLDLNTGNVKETRFPVWQEGIVLPASGPTDVQLTVSVHARALVLSRSLSYGVWPPRPPWGRLKL